MINTKKLNKLVTDMEKKEKRNTRRRELSALKKEEIKKEETIKREIKKALKNLNVRCEETAKNGKKYLPLISKRSTSGNQDIDFWHSSEDDTPEYFYDIAFKLEEQLEKKKIDFGWRQWSEYGVVTWKYYALCVVWDGKGE